MSPQKPHRIRVRVIDGRPREWNKLKGQLGSHLDVLDAKDKLEFVICAVNEKQVAQARDKFGAAGLEEIPGGDTNSALTALKPSNVQQPRREGTHQLGRTQPQHVRPESSSPSAKRLSGKPYGFIPLPKELTTAPPVWHDGTSVDGRLSGEVRCELKTLTPLLVGWERGVVGSRDESWPAPASIEGIGRLAEKKSVLCPLRAPWEEGPVVLPADSLKGLLRHELGALLGAPMERVAERSYSYRPNAKFPKDPGPRLIARLARVPRDGVETKPLNPDDTRNAQARVPTRLELLPENLKYDKKRERTSDFYRFDDGNGAEYRGGQGAGQKLNSTRKVHRKLLVNPSTATDTVDVPTSVHDGYLATVRHFADLAHGHFSERHPDVPTIVTGAAARERILKAAAYEVFQPGDLIWVEWDTESHRIVSLGWHYYYRWAYTDTVRRRGGGYERYGLFPLPDERAHDDAGAPRGLSPVRRLFGYTGDNEGSVGIGKEDHTQLMGRVSVNAALEVVAEGDTDDKRFLPPTFLKELGIPRPSAVEHYLEQPHYPRNRPSDRANLATYGDAAGYDEPGKLAGRKFYLDREEAYPPYQKNHGRPPWEDDSPDYRDNPRSTLAIEASRPERKFRFTIRFRDLDAAEVAAIVVALCPHQFREVLGGNHPAGYCSKLGYARPLGWGSVRIEAKSMLLLDATDAEPTLNAVPDLLAWLREHHQPTAVLSQWLAIHRHNHPNAADYPREKDRDGKEQIFTFHTSLRAEHSRLRRFRSERNR